MNIICFIKTIWRSSFSIIRSGFAMSGHDLVEDEVIENAEVHIGHCKVCDKLDISWKK